MAKKVEVPMETKYKFAIGGYQGVFKGFMHALQERDGGDATLKLYETVCKKGDRVKNVTNTLLETFKIEGNDMEAIAKWHEIWWELVSPGMERTDLERSKTIWRNKITKCPWKTDYKDISDWYLIFENIAVKTINPKATVERPKAMCAGDPYCEYVIKIEE